MDFFLVAKICVQLGFIGFFFVFFGKPSLERFLEKQVLTVTSKRYSDKVLPPAVTIVAYDGDKGGWDQAVPTKDSEALQAVCGDQPDIERCIRSHSRGLEETAFVEMGGISGSAPWAEALTDPALWREDFTSAWYGRSFTLTYPHARGTAWRTDAINIHVNKSDGLNRRIFLHDPNYFILSVNPLSLPINLQTLESSRQGRFYFSLALTERLEYDTPSDPCVEEHGYSFLTCVKVSFGGLQLPHVLRRTWRARRGAGCRGTPTAPRPGPSVPPWRSTGSSQRPSRC